MIVIYRARQCFITEIPCICEQVELGWSPYEAPQTRYHRLSAWNSPEWRLFRNLLCKKKIPRSWLRNIFLHNFTLVHGSTEMPVISPPTLTSRTAVCSCFNPATSVWCKSRVGIPCANMLSMRTRHEDCKLFVTTINYFFLRFLLLAHVKFSWKVSLRCCGIVYLCLKWI